MRIRGALEITATDSREVIAGLGQMCGAANALPAAVHLIVTHEHDLEKALIENTMAGGDSAGRGLAVGMVLGAHLGMEAIPEHWLTEMRSYDHIVELLDQLP
jgi:ADP-ribosylglycohydrolase